MTATVSVIVPVWNEAARIADCLRRLEGHGFHEVIVVDGGSTDDTVARAAKVGHTAIVAPRGRAAQMNAGAAVATGTVLLFLHVDVTLPDDASAHIAAALSHDDVVAGAFQTWTVVDDDAPTARWHALLHLADLRSRYTRRPYGDQAVFVRRAAFDDVGGFAVLPLMEDVDLARRLAARGQIARVPARVRVSGRRFVARPLFFFAVMNTFPLLFRLGVSPGRLAAIYGHIR